MSDVVTFVLAINAEPRNPSLIEDLENYGYSPRVVAATDLRKTHPQLLEPIVRPRSSRLLYGQPLTPGEVGCATSHLQILESVGPGAKWALVLEDDAAVLPEFKLLTSLLGHLNSEEPIGVSLFCDDAFSAYQIARSWQAPEISLVTLRQPPNRTVAYVLSAAALRVACRHGKDRVIHRADWPAWASRLKWKAVLPSPVVHLEHVASTIGASRIAQQATMTGVWRSVSRMVALPFFLSPSNYEYDPSLYVRHDLLAPLRSRWARRRVRVP